jgi:hypothetical protein
MSQVVADRIDTVGDLMRAIEDTHYGLSDGRESVDAREWTSKTPAPTSR